MAHIECNTPVFVVTESGEIREGRYVYEYTPKGVPNGLARVTFRGDSQSHHNISRERIFLNRAAADQKVAEDKAKAEAAVAKPVVAAEAPTAEELKAESDAVEV